MPEQLYLIDTFSLLFQVYHAIPQMTGPAGQPTNAVFGFTRDLLMILKQKRPDYLLCAIDSEGPGIRSDWYPEYKIHRTEMPEDMVPQIPMLIDVIAGFGIPLVKAPGWEADDVIATLTRQAELAGLQVNIVSSDKDCRQLLGDHVRIFNCRKGEYFGPEELKQTWGIEPRQVIDFQSLVGDAVDNVPGVPLIGPKKATALLEQFGDLEGVLAHASLAPGKKLQENLVTFADQARISQKLVTLRTDLPLDFELESARVGGIDTARLQQLFLDFGFRKFREELHELPGSLVVNPTPRKQQRGLFDIPAESETASPTSTPASRLPVPEIKVASPFQHDREWTVVRDEQTLADLISTWGNSSEICIDLETTSVDAMRAEIVGWAVAVEPGRAWYIPVRGPQGQPVLDDRQVLEAFRPLLENPAIAISNQNLKYDLLVWKRHGVNLATIGMDPMVGHYLLDAGARSHGLNSLADEFLKHRMIPISELIGTGKTQQRMDEVDIDVVAEYASEDADAALQIAHIVRDKLRQEQLWTLYQDVERPLIGVLADMEFAGIRVDERELFEQSQVVGKRVEELLEELKQSTHRPFNPDSPKQLREVLFDDLGLPVQKRTKTGPSTDQSVLEKLALFHPLPAKIIEYRQLAKLKGTYLDALPKMIHPETGRIHASFNQVVAATGRLSSSDPNLQNIPVRTAEGRRIRKAFIPGQPGWELLCCDYSQIELRVLAHFSGDAALQQAFREGKDIHAAVAAEVFQVDEAAVDADMRRVAKAVNFGVIYGQSPFGLAESLRIPQEQAAEFIEDYFQRYPGVTRFIETTLEECVRSGYAYTLLGRRRPITGIKNTGGRNRNLPERTAINTVIQGSAADLIKLAMLNVHRQLADAKLQARMLLQIHDELVFEAPTGELAPLRDLVQREMSTAMSLTVPLVVDMKHGQNWLEAK
ncbi:MAG: DNA polymerase I [Planctomycetaceae bacterium]|nr:DNA polymerase I [Planctomycetaceae bacterium]